MEDNQRFTTEKEREVYNEPTINKIAGTYSGSCRIIGSGSSLWNDLSESEAIMPGSDTICVNLSGMVIIKATHLFSWHYKQIGHIKGWRRAEWCDEKAIVHSVHSGPNIDYVWKFNGGTSVSGLSAIDLAWLLGYRKIALVGVPMDGKGYFYKPIDNVEMHDKYRHREVGALKDYYKDMIRSFSGYTAEVMGKPDLNWVRS
jgi:hypothetical protein